VNWKSAVFCLWFRVDWYEFTNVSEVLTASTVRAISNLMMEAIRTFKTLVKLAPVYTALQPRRQPSSYSPL
jgi:hypothetical protein